MQHAKTVFFTLLITSFLLTGVSFGADVAKIGIVDFQRIFETSTAGKSVKAEITKEGKRMKSALEKKGGEIEELKKRIEREAVVMSKEMREEKEREFRIKVNDIKMLQKKYEKELQRIQKRLVNKIKKDVFGIVQEVGKSEGYLLVIEKIGVLYAPNTIDITDKMIKLLNDKTAQKAKSDG